ncbi:MAG: hypothetical protein ABSC63_21650 [Candidatus Binataceae bacterium]|jgi:hypothetical protein
MSEGLREADTIGGERVECRGFDLLVSVAADMIGAQSIDGDEEHIGGGFSWGGRLAPGCRSEPCDPDKYPDDPEKNNQPSHKRSAYHSASVELSLVYQDRLDDAIAELRRAVELTPQDHARVVGQGAKVRGAKGFRR